MESLIDHLNVAWALRNQSNGQFDFDRLARAGLPGSIVMDNMLSRMVDDAEEANAQLKQDIPLGNQAVELYKGKAANYGLGRFAVHDCVNLEVNLSEPLISGISGVVLTYALANERGEDWSAFPSAPERMRIFRDMEGPVDYMSRQLIKDHASALRSPHHFVVDTIDPYLEKHDFEAE